MGAFSPSSNLGAPAEKNYELGIMNWKSDKFDEFDKSDEFDKFDDDKNPFTRAERKQIRISINQAYDESRQNQERSMEILNERASNNDETAIKELKIRRTLKDVVKVERPKTIMEHIKIVNSDIEKVFHNNESNNFKPINQIPAQFSLSQNYPNPFNPTTTIRYELPQNVKVVIKVYDIICREVKILVNEFKQAGYYKIEFNGTGLASGVYFYRIKAGEFVQSKKMVLLK